MDEWGRDRIRYWTRDNPHRDADAIWCLTLCDAQIAGRTPPTPADTLALVRVLRDHATVTAADRALLADAGIAVEVDA